MDVLKFTFHVPDPAQELLIAELDNLGFEAFMQENHQLDAYLPEIAWQESHQSYIESWLRRRGLETVIDRERIAPNNWNTQWEQSVEPIEVAGLYIRPSWAPAASKEGLQEIVIDPKMSFGTGHHESTRLALTLLTNVIQPGDQVLDAGTGTGVLAIAAIKLGAEAALAFDVDSWVEENMQENVERNGVASDVLYREGTLEVVQKEGFDLILANINRTVLVDYLPGFASKVRTGGLLILSGLLLEDRVMMGEAAARAGFQLQHETQEGAWWAGVFKLETITIRLGPTSYFWHARSSCPSSSNHAIRRKAGWRSQTNS